MKIQDLKDFNEKDFFDESDSYIKEGKASASEIIKELINTSWSGSNEEQMKAVQLLKGIALSDEEVSNKFMKKLDNYTSGLSPEDFK